MKKSVIQHLTALGIFLVITLFYCYPALQGNKLVAGDTIHWMGMSQEARTWYEKTGENPMWSNWIRLLLELIMLLKEVQKRSNDEIVFYIIAKLFLRGFGVVPEVGGGGSCLKLVQFLALWSDVKATPEAWRCVLWVIWPSGTGLRAWRKCSNCQR